MSDSVFYFVAAGALAAYVYNQKDGKRLTAAQPVERDPAARHKYVLTRVADAYRKAAETEKNELDAVLHVNTAKTLLWTLQLLYKEHTDAELEESMAGLEELQQRLYGQLRKGSKVSVEDDLVNPKLFSRADVESIESRSEYDSDDFYQEKPPGGMPKELIPISTSGRED